MKIPVACRAAFSILVVLLLAACSPDSGGPKGQSPNQAGKLTLEPEYLPTQEQAARLTLEATPSNQRNSEPLRFSFPTPQPPPVSLWRPALYDIPWALGPFDHFYFGRPIAADEVNWPLADYRYGGMLKGSKFIHTGVDIDARLHTPIIAAGAGTVTSAGFGLYAGSSDPEDPYGLAVTIKHDFGYQGRALYTIYAHMDRIDVKIGQHVEAGEALGIVGLTGNTSGPHIHFEVRIEDNSIFTTRNPELWLAPPQGWGVLVGRMLNSNKSFLTGHEVQVMEKATEHKWTVLSYHNTTINGDDYYQENLVLSDLPAGDYVISLVYQDKPYKAEMKIRPGAVTYFTFRGRKGFDFTLPSPMPSTDWQFFKSFSQ